MKDLFVGPLGRANNHGESRMCAIPHTIGVEPEYDIETDVPSVAEFVTCSLDGRLWLFRRARRYYISALKPNKPRTIQLRIEQRSSGSLPDELKGVRLRCSK